MGVIGLRKILFLVLTIVLLGLFWVACWEVAHRLLGSGWIGIIVAFVTTAVLLLAPLLWLWRGGMRTPAPHQVLTWLERRGWLRPTIYGLGKPPVMVAWRNDSAQPPRTLVITLDVLRAMERGGDAARDLDTLQAARFLDTWEEVVIRPATPMDEQPTRLRDGLFVVERGGPARA